MENKGLEALKRLTVDKYANFLRRNEDITVIEKELKRLEIIKKHIWYYKEQNRFIFVNMDEDGIMDLLKEVLR